MKKVEKTTSQQPLVIDFTKIEVADLSGQKQVYNVAESLGNYIFRTTGDLTMFEACRIIHAKGTLEISEPVRQGLVGLLKDPNCPFLAAVKVELLKKLELTTS